MYANVDLISHARVRDGGMQKNPSVAVDVRDDRWRRENRKGPLVDLSFGHGDSLPIGYPLALACTRHRPRFMAAARTRRLKTNARVRKRRDSLPVDARDGQKL